MQQPHKGANTCSLALGSNGSNSYIVPNPGQCGVLLHRLDAHVYKKIDTTKIEDSLHLHASCGLTQTHRADNGITMCLSGMLNQKVMSMWAVWLQQEGAHPGRGTRPHAHPAASFPAPASRRPPAHPGAPFAPQSTFSQRRLFPWRYAEQLQVGEYKLESPTDVAQVWQEAGHQGHSVQTEAQRACSRIGHIASCVSAHVSTVGPASFGGLWQELVACCKQLNSRVHVRKCWLHGSLEVPCGWGSAAAA